MNHTPTGRPIRLWPGVTAAALMLFVRYVLPAVAPGTEIFGLGTDVIAMIGALLVSVLIFVWWIFFSRAPWSDRLISVAAIVLAIFYFIILLPMRRRQKKVDEFLKNLKVGDKVITSGGLYASITRVGDQTLQLQLAEKIRVEVARTAIVGFQGQEPVASEGPSK